VLGFEFQLVQFLRLDENVMPLGVLVALDDFFLGNLFEALVRFDALHIADRFPTRLMDHSKGNGAFSRSGRVKPDGNENEGEAKIARPNGNGSHAGYSGTTDFPNLGEMDDGTSEQRWTAMKKPGCGGASRVSLSRDCWLIATAGENQAAAYDSTRDRIGRSWNITLQERVQRPGLLSPA
jgi:hypothetical protein